MLKGITRSSDSVQICRQDAGSQPSLPCSRLTTCGSLELHLKLLKQIQTCKPIKQLTYEPNLSDIYVWWIVAASIYGKLMQVQP